MKTIATFTSAGKEGGNSPSPRESSPHNRGMPHRQQHAGFAATSHQPSPGASPNWPPFNQTRCYEDLRIRGLIWLRWGAIGGHAAVLATCIGWLRIPVPLLLPVLVLLAAVLSQAVLWQLNRCLSKPGNSLVGGALALDVLLLTAMLYLTGGPHNPFTILYLTQVAVAASLLGVRWTWSLLGLVLVCFAGLFWWHVPLPLLDRGEAICGFAPAKLHLAGMFFALAFTGGCLAWFVARLNAQLWDRKQLERKVDQVTHREQHALGVSLHEDLCQRLSGLAALGKMLESRLQGASAAEAEVAGEITRELKETLRLANQMADRLQPIASLDNGFLAAVTELAAVTQAEFGTPCEVIDRGFPAVLDHNTASHLYRVVQEAVTNVIRHARATMMQIRLSSSADAIHVEVADDGIGISDSPSAPDRLGLQMMRYRSDLIKATLSISRISPHGTTVAVAIPQT